MNLKNIALATAVVLGGLAMPAKADIIYHYSQYGHGGFATSGTFEFKPAPNQDAWNVWYACIDNCRANYNDPYQDFETIDAICNSVCGPRPTLPPLEADPKPFPSVIKTTKRGGETTTTTINPDGSTTVIKEEIIDTRRP